MSTQKTTLDRFFNDRSEPSLAAITAATQITPAQYADVYCMASILDGVATEARRNERERILSMGFWALCVEFWKGRKLHAQE